MKQGRVIVVGAGLAGLNAARVISQAGHSVTVLEASDRVGGRMATDVIDGYICDRGFQVINPAYSELRETGLIAHLGIRPLPKAARIIDGESQIVVGDPRSGIRYLIGDLSSRSGAVRDKWRFLRYLSRATEDVSFGAAMEECGTFFDRTLSPFLTGVFLTDPEGVSNQMARELLHWFIKGRPGLAREGAQALPVLLSAGLDIRLNTVVSSVSTGTVTDESKRWECDAIVIAADPIRGADLSGRSVPEMVGCTTWYHSTASGTLSARELRIPLSSPIINSVVLSNTATNFAPEGKQLISTTTLAKTEESTLRKELKKIWSYDVDHWDLVHRVEVRNALPVHRAQQSLVQTPVVAPGIYVAGDWRAIPAQQGALLSGRLAALKVISDLQER